MMDNYLWIENTPQRFWLCEPEPPDHVWKAAVQAALPILGFSNQGPAIDDLLQFILGEGQFGSRHWRLSPVKRLYYLVKPLLPRVIIDLLKGYNSHLAEDSFILNWPIEKRYVQFQWEVMKQVMLLVDDPDLRFRCFWPEGERFAFVLTHDIESSKGQAFIRNVADLEEELGFRSSFNFVPERYPVDYVLMDELRSRGFEIGVHGLKHDGKLYHSSRKFNRRAERINHYLEEFNAVGFRSPLMHRHPQWLQTLNVEYDLSFFDTDPYEPMPGGTMSIWPITLGRFVELPYTLVQDSTLFYSLGERTPNIWLEKVEFLKRYYGMALVNTHPDYLKEQMMLKIYRDFLKAIKQEGGYWHALPRDVANWWRSRSNSNPHEKDKGETFSLAQTVLTKGGENI